MSSVSHIKMHAHNKRKGFCSTLKAKQVNCIYPHSGFHKTCQSYPSLPYREFFFSQIRSKGGHRYNASAKDFRYSYRSLSCQMMLAAIQSPNCSSVGAPLLSDLTKLSDSSQAVTHSSPSAVSASTVDNVCQLSAADFELPCKLQMLCVTLHGIL